MWIGAWTQIKRLVGVGRIVTKVAGKTNVVVFDSAAVNHRLIRTGRRAG